MQNNKALISIIIPCKNSEKHFTKTLQSLHSQNTFFEVIFVYTKSSDNTLNILKKFTSKNIKKKILRKNCRISEALNLGINAAEGQFIMWIGSDDILVSNFIIRIKKILENQKKTNWIITKTKILSNKKFLKKKIEKYKFVQLKNLTFKKLLTENPISASGVIFSKNFFKNVGKFNQSYLFNSDYDMWLRMYYKCKPKKINIFSTYYNRHSDSLSSKYFFRQFLEQFIVSNMYKEKKFLTKLNHLFKIFIIIVIYKIFRY